MTILLYDHIELKDRPSKHLKAWKGCHLVLYSLAAIFGLLNFVFIQNAMHLVDDNCVLFPRKLDFHMVELPITETDENNPAQKFSNMTEDAQNKSNDTSAKTKRDTIVGDGTNGDAEDVSREGNGTEMAANTTHRPCLDTSRTLFSDDENQCQFAEFMPIMSTIFSAVWLTLFTMCPGGGHSRAGLQQPWRLMMPALLFSIVMVGLTGSSFSITNKGLLAFCEAFSDVTNSSTCSSVNPYLERGWNESWGFGGRAAATRAASAGVLAAWACAAALLLARCLAGPDFEVKRTGVYLAKDPQKKIIPHLRMKSPRSQRLSNNSSPTKRDTLSIHSEPTAVTELVSASVEPGHDSAPSSLLSTPAHAPRTSDAIEMTYNPQERFMYHP